MAEYKGLTIRFEGDDSDLSAVLHRIGDNARDAQRHLTGISSALRLDPSNAKIQDLRLGYFAEEAKAARDRLAALNTAFEEAPQKIERASAEIDRLEGEISEGKNRLSELTSETRQNTEEFDRLGTRSSELTKRMDELKQAGMENSEEFRNLQREDKEVSESMERVMEAAVRTADAHDELAEQVRENAEAYNKAEQDIENAERALAKLPEDMAIAEARAKGLDSAVSALSGHTEAASTKFYGFGTALASAGDMMSTAGDKLIGIGTSLSTIAGISMVTFGRNVIENTEDFGNAISQVGGYLGITGDELAEMQDLALYWGKETQYSATEAAQAMSELAKGGLTPAEIAGGALKTTMRLAAAGQLDLADAATTTVQAMRAFGLSADDVTEVADALAGAASNSTTTVEGLAGGFRYVAGWSRLAEWDIHEVAGALGLLADYGLTGEMAGTALRNVLMRLAAPTDKARGIMEQYGIEVRDSTGQMKTAVEIIGELQEAFEGVSEEERDAALNTMFGARGINAASALIDAGSDELQKYIEYTEQEGAAAELAQAQMGDLGWALEYLRGEAETASVNIGNALTPVLVDLAEKAEDVLSAFNEMNSEEQFDVVKRIAGLALAGPSLVAVGTALKGLGAASSGIGNAFRFTSELFSQLKFGGTAAQVLGRTTAGLKGLVAAGMSAETVAANVAAETAAASSALAGLAAAAGIALVAVVALGVAEIWMKYEEARKRTEKLESAMGALTSAAGDSGRAVEELGDDLDDTSMSASELKDEVEELADAQLDLAKQIRDDNRQLSANEDSLKSARDTVLEYLDAMTSGADLDAEAQGRLATALKVLEDQYGITISKGEDGIYYLETEEGQADLTSDAIYRLCDAKLYEMQLNAYEQRYEDLYKQKLDLEEARADAAERAVEAEQELARLQTMTPEQRAEEFGTGISANARYSKAVRDAQESVDSCNQSVEELDGMLVDVNNSLNDTTYEMGAVEAAAEGAEQSIGQWAATDDRIRQFAAGSLTDFGNALDNANIDAEKMQGILQGLSDDQLSTLMGQFDGTSDSVRNALAVLTGDTSLFSSAWETTISTLASRIGVSEGAIADAIAQGIEDGTLRAGASVEGLGRFITEQFGPAAAGKAGADAGEALANGMVGKIKRTLSESLSGSIRGTINNPKNLHDAAQAGEDIGDEAANGVGVGMGRASSMVNSTMKRIDMRGMAERHITNPLSDALKSASANSRGLGDRVTTNFAAGMSASKVSGKASSVAESAKQIGKYSASASTWGYHLVSNFAAGMSLASGLVSAAADRVASTLAGKLKHSVPKEGPLHDDDVWGLHLGQNFASGIYDALPEIERASLAMAEAVQQPTVELGYDEGSFYTGIADSVMANQNVNIYFNGNRINDDPAMRSAFLGLMYEASRYSNMNGRRG